MSICLGGEPIVGNQIVVVVCVSNFNDKSEGKKIITGKFAEIFANVSKKITKQ